MLQSVAIEQEPLLSYSIFGSAKYPVSSVANGIALP